MDKWIVCDVCGCRYAKSIDAYGKPPENAPCPAIRITKTSLKSENDIWTERALKHNPDWRVS